MNQAEKKRLRDLQDALIDTMSKIVKFDMVANDDVLADKTVSTEDIRKAKFRTRTTPFAQWYDSEDVDALLDKAIYTIYDLSKTNAKFREELKHCKEVSA